MSFELWNARLLESYFGPQFSGASTWLTVSATELDEIGRDLGGDAGFIVAVRHGPSWPTEAAGYSGGWVQSEGSGGFQARALGLFHQWTRRGREPRPSGYVDPGVLAPAFRGTDAPPFLPYLAAFCRVWLEKPKESGAAYYPVLNDTYGLDWSSQEMQSMSLLWSGVRDWAERHRGRLGRFVVTVAGSHSFIGIPRSHALLTHRDIDRLSTIFAQAGFRPGAQIEPARLANAVVHAPANVSLSSVVTDILKAGAAHDLYSAALARLADAFADWDGSYTKTESDGGDRSRPVETVRIALRLSEGNNLPWQPRLHVDAIRGDGEYLLWQNTQPRESPAFRFMVSSRLGCLSMESAEGLFARLRPQGHELFSLEDRSGWNVAAALQAKPLYVLRAQQESEGALELVEADAFPSYGQAYFLVHPSNTGRVAAFQVEARLHGVILETCPVVGLPTGWALYSCGHLERFEKLPRDVVFPSGAVERTYAPVIRFVGGTRVRRGGATLFLPYDLPVVEVDAPARATVRGLPLVEFKASESLRLAGGKVPLSAGTRYFEVGEFLDAARHFRIEVLDGETLLASAALRVAPDEGLPPAGGSRLGLDAFGFPARTGPRACGGEVLDSAASPMLVRSPGRPAASGVPLDWLVLQTRPSTLFLDRLSLGGTLTWGRARDFARNLLTKTEGAVRFDIGTDMLRLRERGFIEIETDRKGRWMKFHAPSAVVYTLPTQEQSGVTAALAGAFSLRQWADFLVACKERDVTLEVVDEGRTPLVPPTIYAKARSIGALEAAASHAGVGSSVAPSLALAAIAGAIDAHWKMLVGFGTSQPPPESARPEVFQSATGRYMEFRKDGLGRWNDKCEAELFRQDDTEVRQRSVFGIRYMDGESQRFAHVRDRRWGTWHALRAFWKYIAPLLGLDPESPWPVAYEAHDQTVWLPVDLGVPVILERCLVLCSGRPPLKRDLSRHEGTARLPGRLAAGEEGSRDPLVSLSLVYSDFVPSPPERPRPWLCYRGVPREVADRVAHCLGGTIDLVDTGRIAT